MHLFIRNIDTFRETFKGCKSLEELPDISKWDTSRVVDMSNMFEDCESLKSLPDIEIWKTDQLKNCDDMFKNCKLLEGKIPLKFQKSPTENK